MIGNTQFFWLPLPVARRPPAAGSAAIKNGKPLVEEIFEAKKKVNAKQRIQK